MQYEEESGFLQRIREEYGHWTQVDWTFQEVGRHWDRVEDYDEINQQTYSYRRRFIDGLRLSSLRPGSHVLDICARTGVGTGFFYERGLVRSAICADVSFNMGAICRRYLREIGFTQFAWVPVMDYDLPFADATFDAVLCFETVEHFSEPGRLVAELGRITRVGGELILTTPNVLWEPLHAIAAIMKWHHSEGPHRFIRYKPLLEMVEDAGFTVVQAETTVLIPGGPPLLIKLGEWIEKRTRYSLMPLFGLRRVVVARR